MLKVELKNIKWKEGNCTCSSFVIEEATDTITLDDVTVALKNATDEQLVEFGSRSAQAALAEMADSHDDKVLSYDLDVVAVSPPPTLEEITMQHQQQRIIEEVVKEVEKIMATISEERSDVPEQQ